jgi:hypothetical protein
MAPSRANLIRRITSACVQPQIRIQHSARLLSTSAALARPQLARATAIPRFQTANAYTRSYSAQASGAPEPPDFLNEAELHIFNKIKTELEPVKLEVRNEMVGGRPEAIDKRCTRNC